MFVFRFVTVWVLYCKHSEQSFGEWLKKYLRNFIIKFTWLRSHWNRGEATYTKFSHRSAYGLSRQFIAKKIVHKQSLVGYAHSNIFGEKVFSSIKFNHPELYLFETRPYPDDFRLKKGRRENELLKSVYEIIHESWNKENYFVIRRLLCRG